MDNWGSGRIEIIASIGRSWNLLKTHLGLILVVTILFVIIQSAIQGPAGIGHWALEEGHRHRSPIVIVLHAIAVPLVIFGWLLSAFLAGPLYGGYIYFFLKLIREGKAGIEDLFSGYTTAFVPLGLTSLLVSALTGLGFMLCLIPGIYLAVAWAFALPLVIERGMQPWDAMELSRKVITRQWFPMFGLLVLAFILAMSGVLACCVGIFFTLPILPGALAFAYEDLFAERRASAAVVIE
jgi:uncharacterized membrane protein